MSLLEYIPPKLRAPVVKVDLPVPHDQIDAYLSRAQSVFDLYLNQAMLSGEMSAEQAHMLLDGFLEHQRNIVSEDPAKRTATESKVFRGIVTSLDPFERSTRDDDVSLGTKIRVSYEPLSGNSPGKEEDISTGWLVYNRTVGAHNLWEVVLTRSILIDIENTPNETEVTFRKAYVHGVQGLKQGDRVKYLADYMTNRRKQLRPFVDEALAQKAVELALSSKPSDAVDDIADLIEKETGKMITDLSFAVLESYVLAFLKSKDEKTFKREIQGFFPKAV